MSRDDFGAVPKNETRFEKSEFVSVRRTKRIRVKTEKAGGEFSRSVLGRRVVNHFTNRKCLKIW
ncbi:hypothetical protein CH375_08475 [Leptospira ellisii]|uniref:Uncharacterized protein n=1 Tax=Leptospira ellisii TaxID=2023197 RepID=A0A2N0BLK2_9LEPT|nr:hypothetical protein CH379_03725 [Leptospira ellisii]PKA04866.1 hypothetical protein CH375_08475 [Leptospira ellisii]